MRKLAHLYHPIVTCIYLPNFIQVEWRHIDFSRWRPWRRNSYSGCVFSDKWHSFDVSQSTAE